MLPLLAYQVVSQYYRLQRNPITVGLLAANTLIHLRPDFLHPIIPSIEDVWFNAHLILKVTILANHLILLSCSLFV